MTLRLSDFDFHLPDELIAQEPLARRDRSKLMHVAADGAIDHGEFSRLPTLLSEGDLVVVNDTLVYPARLFGRRSSGGAVEVLLIRDLGRGRWEILAKPGKKLREGATLTFGDGRLEARVVARDPLELEFSFEGEWDAVLEALGLTPLPPYIRSEASESQLRERYQTVYASARGSIAAPTAGLHFTAETFAAFEDRGVAVAKLTHHVGYATFAPMRTETIAEHRMGVERYEISTETAAYLRSARRVVAVGTTTVRALESAAAHDFSPGWHETDLFITPGFEFRVIGGLVTNFHLPKSTLLLLVSALGGVEEIRRAYLAAVAARYRFYSFGDAMLVYPARNGVRGI